MFRFVAVSPPRTENDTKLEKMEKFFLQNLVINLDVFFCATCTATV